MKIERLFQILQSLFFALTLAGDLDFQALRNIPVSLAPDGRSERSFHDHILSYAALTSKTRASRSQNPPIARTPSSAGRALSPPPASPPARDSASAAAPRSPPATTPAT